ncbi:MAG: 3'-5' exonuclease, partial [Bacteroidales bacterium]
VRERKEGIEITEAINRYNQTQTNPQNIIHVLSAETALLDKCVAINLITEVFQYILNPDDIVNQVALIAHMRQIRQLTATPNTADHTEVSDTPLEQFAGLLFYSPLELLEEVIQAYRLNQYEPFVPYLLAFHNLMHDFCLKYTPQLQAFMDYWERKKNKVALEISEQQDAVRILTIHKSKGLQYPNVIIPYCSWELDYRWNLAPLLWCKARTPLVESLQYIPVRYAKELEDTSFAEDYQREKDHYFIDNINLLYVAFTRPMHHLFVYVPLVDPQNDKCKTVGDWLYRYVKNYSQSHGSQMHFQKGQLQHVEEPRHLPEHEVDLFKHYPVYSPVGKIKQRSAFGGMLAQTMQYGNVMHRLFQYIRYFDDINRAVDILIAEGLLSSRNREASIAWLRDLLTRPEVASWFSPEWKIYTEATVVAPSQHPYRPDRVMIKDNQAIVVDYKFGTIELSSYKSQLKTYMNFLKGMGYLFVEGYLWYVQLDKIEKVE